MGRSFKYHRPRGAVTAGSEEPNALIGTRRGPGRFEPNTRATVQEIYEGLATESQNKWPSLKFDVGAVNDSLSMLFSAGFYYKTFMWPQELLGQGLRAGHPRRRRPRQGAVRAGPGHLRLALPALRRAGGRRWRGRHRRGARSRPERREGRAGRRGVRDGRQPALRAVGRDRGQARLGLASRRAGRAGRAAERAR